MAKPGFSANTVPALLPNAAATHGWSLCVGAGTSLPAFPSWQHLVRRLVEKDVTASRTAADALLRDYSPDSLIEAARHRLGLDDAAFGVLLADELYALLQAEAAAKWPDLVRCLEAEAIASVNREGWLLFEDFFRNHPAFATCSALHIADVLAPLLGGTLGPSSILSFNAEPLLLALINAAVARHHNWDRGAGVLNAPPQPLDKLTRSTSTRIRGRVPYIFCHGLLRIPLAQNNHADSSSTDKLVFLEEQYLALANAVVSWQATTFIETCMTQSVVFIGVSLTDPNMRHWLSRVARNRRQELHDVHGHDGDSTTHYWLVEHPKDDSVAAWIEAVVGHLGVRLVWMDRWRDTGSTLRRLLGQ